jgi:hypothetical protein
MLDKFSLKEQKTQPKKIHKHFLQHNKTYMIKINRKIINLIQILHLMIQFKEVFIENIKIFH